MGAAVLFAVSPAYLLTAMLFPAGRCGLFAFNF